MENIEVLPIGSLVRFDNHDGLVGRIMSISISQGNIVRYEVEWDTDEKGTYATHVFTADRVKSFSLNELGPVQIGFGGTHPECGEATVICRSNK